ncbi:hypothetical protein CLHUN_21700 [Ruminiclostridium hungatei]|uniref:Uncharacterized protein n=1 Tax=Ruminiclostridium hungatei TaxID=48256 RepID=A0A1V4SL07_RUMHU|nr:hypothetical protein CLHUN_21700 [Ruminiclostridium hungatei]
MGVTNASVLRNTVLRVIAKYGSELNPAKLEEDSSDCTKLSEGLKEEGDKGNCCSKSSSSDSGCCCQ